MESGTFTTVLGHPRVLAGSPLEARRRVLAYDGDEVVGVAVFEPLFGRQAEGAIAVAPGSPSGLISYLFDGLMELARNSGVTVLRYALSPGRQRSLAARLTRSCSSQTLRSDRLELHLERPEGNAAPWSAHGRHTAADVATCETSQQGIA